MADFAEIDQARKILSLPEEATLAEIKAVYRKLAFKFHPDKCKKRKKQCEQMVKKINHAYEILMAYCAGYRYSFKEKEVKQTTVDKEYYEHLKRFYDEWWGKLDL